MKATTTTVGRPDRGPLSDFDLGLPPWMARRVERLLALDQVQALYLRVQDDLARQGTDAASAPGAGAFCRAVLRQLGVERPFSAELVARLKAIPGPLIFASNHPFGAVEALVLIDLMSELRTGGPAGYHLMGSHILEAIPELRPSLLSVHVLDRDRRPQRNAAAFKQMLGRLSRGSALSLFPAGEVAAVDSTSWFTARERTWSPHLGRIARRSRATVVPCFFGGQNGWLFQYAGLLVPPLRLALLARELLRAPNKLSLRVGPPIPFGEVEHIATPRALTEHYQRQMLSLRG